tara:strand:+ start:129 stop:572 length:444 start_codon:yes stop_codon:yes gene_type:complete
MVAEALSDKSAKETKSALINIGTSLEGDTETTVELVPLVPGKKIVVTNVNHIQVKPVSPYGSAMIGSIFKSGSSALTGELLFSNTPSGSGFPPGSGYENSVNTGYMPDGHFKTAKGEALNLTVSDKRSGGAATAVTWVYGYINYYEE